MLREGDIGWYVRYEGTGEISGPRSREDAQSLADAAGGIIFSEQIFSPEETIASSEVETIASSEVETIASSEVESLTKDLNKVLVGDLRERAGRIIEELSHPRHVMAGDVSQLIAELRSAADSNAMVVQAPVFFRKAADMIVQLSREKLITGSVHGGVFDLDDIPLGVRVEVRDYDVEGVDNPNNLADEDGEYVLSAWGH